jgi:hypothetical protein
LTPTARQVLLNERCTGSGIRLITPVPSPAALLTAQREGSAIDALVHMRGKLPCAGLAGADDG